MAKQEEQKIMLDILKAELRCKNVDCDKNVIFCSQCSNVKYSDEEIADALRYAIECIEKQIPKKPSIEYTPLFKAYCPICEGRLLPSKWCAKCGQAIDWSDNE